jgi:hypothetical protein
MKLHLCLIIDPARPGATDPANYVPTGRTKTTRN